MLTMKMEPTMTQEVDLREPPGVESGEESTDDEALQDVIEGFAGSEYYTPGVCLRVCA